MIRAKAARKGATVRRRDPDGTRSCIIEAACTVLAKDGPEGLSVSQVAQLAGVNRGTAYQHFQTREQLLAATVAWVSERLCTEVFGGFIGKSLDKVEPRTVANRLVEFAMENPELCRIWLFQILSSKRPSSDPFWKLYKATFDYFAKSDWAQPGIDSEVHSVLSLLGTFLWPVWVGAHSRTLKERQEMTRRYSYETLRSSMYGMLRPEAYPKLAADIRKAALSRKRTKL